MLSFKTRFVERVNRLMAFCRHFGVAKSAMTFLNFLSTRFLFIDCWNIIVLKRERVKIPPNIDRDRLSVRFATYEDLINFESKGLVPKKSAERMKDSWRCLLCFANKKFAGYTWVWLGKDPLMAPGFRLEIPDNLVFNHFAFTLPQFRGMGLQSYRHYALLNTVELSEKEGLIGWVQYTNWASKRGQEKSGYKTIGHILIFGTKRHFYTYFSKALRSFGIQRVSEHKCEARKKIRLKELEAVDQEK